MQRIKERMAEVAENDTRRAHQLQDANAMLVASEESYAKEHSLRLAAEEGLRRCMSSFKHEMVGRHDELDTLRADLAKLQADASKKARALSKSRAELEELRRKERERERKQNSRLEREIRELREAETRVARVTEDLVATHSTQRRPEPKLYPATPAAASRGAVLPSPYPSTPDVSLWQTNALDKLNSALERIDRKLGQE